MLHQADKDRYWEAVELALDVLGADRSLAWKFRRELEQTPLGPQELFYHAEPLDIAKDLTGLELVSEEHMLSYQQKVSERIPE